MPFHAFSFYNSGLINELAIVFFNIFLHTNYTYKWISPFKFIGETVLFSGKMLEPPNYLGNINGRTKHGDMYCLYVVPKLKELQGLTWRTIILVTIFSVESIL